MCNPTTIAQGILELSIFILLAIPAFFAGVVLKHKVRVWWKRRKSARYWAEYMGRYGR